MIQYKDWKSVRRICFLIMVLLSFFIVIKEIYSGTGLNTDTIIEYVFLMIISTVMFTLSYYENDKIFIFETAAFIYTLKILIYDIFRKTVSLQNGNPYKLVYYLILFLFFLFVTVYILRETGNFNVCYRNRKVIILISLFLGLIVFSQIILNIYVINIMNADDIFKNPFFFFKLILSDIILIPVCIYCALKSERNNKYALVYTGIVLFLTASGLLVTSISMFLKFIQYDANILKINFQIFTNDVFLINVIKVFLNLISIVILPVYMQTIEISYIKVFK